tara:strand:- start:210 stop:713 length:504 start_codon:yes stop_codon:yes gene_type:complete
MLPLWKVYRDTNPPSIDYLGGAKKREATMWSVRKYWKRRPIKAMAREDLEKIDGLISVLRCGIGASSAMGERFKGRYARRHDKADYDAMVVADAITIGLQTEYDSLHRLKRAKDAIMKGREPPKELPKRKKAKVPGPKVKLKGYEDGLQAIVSGNKRSLPTVFSEVT